MPIKTPTGGGLPPYASGNEEEGYTLDNVLLRQKDPLVDIRAFGAVGDDNTSNDTALSDALSYAKSNNLTLYIPPGVYQYSSSLMIDQNNFVVKGEGRDSCLKYMGSGKAIQIGATDHTGSGDVTEGVRLQDFRLQNESGSGSATHGIYINDYGIEWTIQRLKIRYFNNSGAAGIENENHAYGGSITNCNIRNCYDGIILKNLATASSLFQNRIYNNLHIGLTLSDGIMQGNVYHGNILANNTGNILIDGARNVNFEGIEMENTNTSDSYHFKIQSDTTSIGRIQIQKCPINSDATLDHAIILNETNYDLYNIDIAKNSFGEYGISAINNQLTGTEHDITLEKNTLGGVTKLIDNDNERIIELPYNPYDISEGQYLTAKNAVFIQDRFKTFDFYGESNSGDYSYTKQFGYVQVETGSSTGHANLYVNRIKNWLQYQSQEESVGIHTHLDNLSGNVIGFIGLHATLLDDTNTGHSTTTSHVGIYYDNGTLYASVANGTNQYTTDVTADISGTGTLELKRVSNGDIEFVWEGTTIATFTLANVGNLAANMHLQFFVNDYTAATSSKINVYHWFVKAE